MSILIPKKSKRYLEGLRKGQRAYQRKDIRDHMSFWDAIKRALWSESEIDAFAKGFYEGYDEELKRTEFPQKVEIINPQESVPQNNNTSMNPSEFKHQIKVLEENIDSLKNFINQLEEDSHDYRNRINNFAEQGMIGEFYEEYLENGLEPTRRMIDEVIDNIRNRDIKLLKVQIDAINKTLGK
ncbi:hypothetical protein M0M57_00485 [Flavobacterium azooxidireducens]|uniref:Uncharacterized protein n=1 Tax=Flavobacterium azooxidireducens TaxID=1871076 RepID=A0ABY4KG99_9FLAO|nr:hypothetical protein [Flavobacterium azooxidireducens]UPQ79331.1 hypothetical protein M0M57_00485 [Flavobacterium azooxidireducens]